MVIILYLILLLLLEVAAVAVVVVVHIQDLMEDLEVVDLLVAQVEREILLL